jgi:arsenical pump membrane protein
VTGAGAEILAVGLLLGVLAFAVARPRNLPEATAAVPAAVLLVAVGAVTPAAAWRQVVDLAPVVAFLAILLVLAHLCDDEGLFATAGAAMARTSRGRPVRLLGAVFVVASVVTAVLSLDATVVLLTPVVFATAHRIGVRAKPHVYACTHLANSASLLLPVSNLTNLLAYSASGLSFARFGAVMALPWLVAVALEYAVLRWAFRTDLRVGTGPVGESRVPDVPVATLVVLGLTLVGFVATSFVGLEPVWAALAGAVCSPSGRWSGGGSPFAVSSTPPAPCSACSSWRSAWWWQPSSTTGSATRWDGCCRAPPTCPRCWPSPRWRPCWPTSSTTCRPCWRCCRCWRRPGRGRCSPP